MEGYICIETKLDAWAVNDVVLRNGTHLEVLHDGKWVKAIVETQAKLYMYEIKEYKKIRCDVLVRI